MEYSAQEIATFLNGVIEGNPDINDRNNGWDGTFIQLRHL